MERYTILKQVGDGAYGSVFKALNKTTGEIVAIKLMKRKFTSWEECMCLRELKSLRKLTHPNIIKLKEVIRLHDDLHFVFEYFGTNVYKLFKEKPESFTNAAVKSFMHQALAGLAYTHRCGFFHRDMKPENLLIQDGVLKIADYGLAREIRSRGLFTDYVSTRWYRAPEVLLHSTAYNSPIDIFALGAILAELYMLRPLFPGSNERDQITRICSVLGSPSSQYWPEGHRLATNIGFTFPNFAPVNLQKMIPNAPPEAIDLMLNMMRFDPLKRPTAEECLAHPYFDDVEENQREPKKCRESKTDVNRHGRDKATLASTHRAVSLTRGEAETAKQPNEDAYQLKLPQIQNVSQKPISKYTVMIKQKADFPDNDNTPTSYKKPGPVPYMSRNEEITKTIDKRLPNPYNCCIRKDPDGLGADSKLFQAALGQKHSTIKHAAERSLDTLGYPKAFNAPLLLKPLAHFNLPFVLPAKQQSRVTDQTKLGRLPSIPGKGVENGVYSSLEYAV